MSQIIDKGNERQAGHDKIAVIIIITWHAIDFRMFVAHLQRENT